MRDAIAESAVLGAVLLNPKVGGPALLSLNAEEFTAAKTRGLAGLLIDLLRKGAQIDPVIVHAESVARGLDLPASWLHEVQEACFDPHSAAAYAIQVREVHRHNAARDAARQLAGRLDLIDESGELDDLDAVLDAGHVAFDHVPEPLDRTTAEPPHTLEDLLAEKPTYDWLVPHLLERSERLMITGQEGLGKSMLLRQLAACLAAGIHPFTWLPFGDGLRVLHVDAENGIGQSRRAYARIAANMTYYHPNPGWRSNLMIECRPDGLDLPGEDRAWWDRICASAAPDVIITGPIYRLALGNPNAEEDVRKLVAALDAPRVRHNAALILEAHAGHGAGFGNRPMRPAGASMWLRWPENGLGMVRGKDDPGDQRAVRVDVTPWRMSREDRAWPREIEHGARYAHELPWKPTLASYDGKVPSIEREEVA